VNMGGRRLVLVLSCWPLFFMASPCGLQVSVPVREAWLPDGHEIAEED
jgi:hypothetical protein